MTGRVPLGHLLASPSEPIGDDQACDEEGEQAEAGHDERERQRRTPGEVLGVPENESDAGATEPRTCRHPNERETAGANAVCVRAHEPADEEPPEEERRGRHENARRIRDDVDAVPEFAREDEQEYRHDVREHEPGDGPAARRRRRRTRRGIPR